MNDTSPSGTPPPDRISRFQENVRPVYDALIGQRYRSGRLRLTGTGGVSRWVATAGLAAIVGLNVSLYLAGVGQGLRRGHLIPLAVGSGAPAFIPTLLLPVTLLALGLAWILVGWGAAVSSGRIRVLIAAAALVVNAGLDQPTVLNLHHDTALTWGPRLTTFGYWAIPSALAAAAVLGWIRWWNDVWKTVVFGVLAVAAACLFGGLIWIHAAADRLGQSVAVPTIMDFSLGNVQNLIFPLLLAAGLEILELAYAVAEAAAVPIRRLATGGVRAALVALLAIKIGVQVAAHTGTLSALLREHPKVVIASSVCTVLLCLGAFVVMRLASARPSEEAAETVVYASAGALAAPLIVALVGIDMILLFNLEIPWHTAAHWFDVSFPRPWLVHYGDLLGSGLIALLGLIALVRRSRPGVASGLVVIGAWGIALATADLNGIDPGIQANVIDLLITGAVIVVLIARWRSLDSGMLARLGALVLFSWLVGTKGDFLQAWLGRFLPVAAVATVVIGLLWLLLTDSALATGDSKVFPMAGRPLLWVGFLLLSVTIANWILVTHALDFRSALIEKGFLHVGLPLAAWLAGTRRFVPPPEVEAEIEEAEADLAQ